MSEQNFQDSQRQDKAHGASTNQDASFHGNGLEEAGAGTGQNFTSQFLDAGTAADQASKATDIRATQYMRGVSSAPSGELAISDTETSHDGLSSSAKAAVNKAAVTQRLRGQGVDESSIQRARDEVDRRSVAEEDQRTPSGKARSSYDPQIDQAQRQAEDILSADAAEERDALALAQAKERLNQPSSQSRIRNALAEIDALLEQPDALPLSQEEPMAMTQEIPQASSLAANYERTGRAPLGPSMRESQEMPPSEEQRLQAQDRNILAQSVYSEFAATTPFMQLMAEEERQSGKAA